MLYYLRPGRIASTRLRAHDLRTFIAISRNATIGGSHTQQTGLNVSTAPPSDNSNCRRLTDTDCVVLLFKQQRPSNVN
ncbi:hypothetical protein FHS27_004821 [Rhodopirellula rubra]|uniref:Uncharacterized protein n=1 Tax=Aporhodopirellula rubra TaxID=980271 RepID=A0A7W5H6W3_9BACT|nr:hypothetical protein [Aporhodopirellula rubra]